MSSNDEQGFIRADPNRAKDLWVERRVQRFTTEFGRILHDSQARIAAAFTYYTELNHRALNRPDDNSEIVRQLESLETRLLQVEGRLDIPPEM